MDIFESLENLNISEECFDDIMGIVEEIITESSHARKYGQKGKNLNSNSTMADIVGTKVIKDSTQMNPDRYSINLINKSRSGDPGDVPDEGDHDIRYTSLHDPDTKRALQDKKALQGAIKSLKQVSADSDTGLRNLRNLKKEARELSRRKDPDENVDILSNNNSYGGFVPNKVKDNYKNIRNSLRKGHGYHRLEKHTKRVKEES